MSTVIGGKVLSCDNCANYCQVRVTLDWDHNVTESERKRRDELVETIERFMRNCRARVYREVREAQR